MTSGSSLHNPLQHILLTSEKVKVQTNFDKCPKVHVNIVIKEIEDEERIYLHNI